MLAHPFLLSEEFGTVTEQHFLRLLLEAVPADSPILYELTFHAAFAKRMFDIIKREGRSVQGFERMQQSFLESVEKIRGELVKANSLYNMDVTLYIAKTPETASHLTSLINDLALLKNWQMSNPIDMKENG